MRPDADRFRGRGCVGTRTDGHGEGSISEIDIHVLNCKCNKLQGSPGPTPVTSTFCAHPREACGVAPESMV